MHRLDHRNRLQLDLRSFLVLSGEESKKKNFRELVRKGRIEDQRGRKDRKLKFVSRLKLVLQEVGGLLEKLFVRYRKTSGKPFLYDSVTSLREGESAIQISEVGSSHSVRVGVE